MKTILLTGATGFLGSHLLEALLKVNYEVVILKRSTSDTWRIKHLLETKLTIYDTDIDSLQQIFIDNSIDVIVHMATLYRKFDNGQEVRQMIDSNISFPVELLELGIRNGIKGFINTGTFFEYDCSELPVHESAKIKPFNLYAKTKVAFENILESYSDQLKINTFRLFSPYGEKDNFKLIPMIIQKALSDEKIELSDGMQKMDFIYASDIIDAYMKGLSKMFDLKQIGDYQVYNLGSGVSTSVREVVSIIEQQLGKPINKVWGHSSKVDIPIVFADITKAREELGWLPKHSIHEGIKKAIKHYQERINQ